MTMSTRVSKHLNLKNLKLTKLVEAMMLFKNLKIDSSNYENKTLSKKKIHLVKTIKFNKKNYKQPLKRYILTKLNVQEKQHGA